MLSQKIKKKALELGYVSCGIIQAAAFDEYKKYVDERVNSFPESKELYQRFYSYVTPPAEAKSIIVCIQRTNRYKIPESLNGIIGRVLMFDGRLPYSYENRAKEEFEAYFKTIGINIVKCQIPDRWAAAKAGLGKFGYNNLIYSPEHGSYIWIMSWVVDRELEYDTKPEIKPENLLMSACSDSCNKCVEACPTKALSGGLSMDMGKCASRLSFYAKDTLDEATREQMGQMLYGCDICQDVCPQNYGKLTGNEDFPLLTEYEDILKLENILTMDEDTYLNVINPRFFYTGREGLWLWKCNALRAMINSKDAKYHKTIKEHCNNEDLRLREIAVWGCKKLGL
jgi:epoxyqueuosine reductase